MVQEIMLRQEDLSDPLAGSWTVLPHPSCSGGLGGEWVGVLGELFQDGWPERRVHLPKAVRPPLGIRDVERLATARLRSPLARVYSRESETPALLHERIGSQPAGDIVDLAMVRQALAAGATLVLQHVDWVEETVRRLVHGIARWTHSLVGANAYWTPQRNRGLSPHFDAHHVLVVQCEGTKEWILHRQVVESPHGTCTDSTLGLTPQDLVVRNPTSAILHPGDVLWIPAGLVHEAATHDESSLHLTVALQGLSLNQIFGDPHDTTYLGPGFVGCPERSQLDPDHYDAESRNYAEWWALFGMNATSPRVLRLHGQDVITNGAYCLNGDAVNAVGELDDGRVALHLGDRIVVHSSQSASLAMELLDSSGTRFYPGELGSPSSAEFRRTWSLWHSNGVVTAG